MRQIMLVPIVLTAFLATTGPSDAELWKTVGNWEVRIDDIADKTCFARRVMEDGKTVFMGFEPDRSGGFFAVYNPDWTHIEEGQKGLIEFDFGDERFAGNAVGGFREDMPGGYAYFNNPAFADAIARYETVEISGSGGTEFSLALSGTFKAVQAVRECQKEQGATD